MNPSSLFRRPVVLVSLVAVVVAGLGVGAYFLWWKRQAPELPGPGTERYEQYVEAFQVGVAALDADRYQIAKDRLTRAIEFIPEEPAAWADRGLLHLRYHELKPAARDLARAHELAPDDPAIETLLGLLAERQGRYPQAVEHLGKAVAARPRDVAARYALAQLLAKEGTPEAAAEAQRQLEAILKVQPTNLFVLKELAASAARRRDRAVLRDVLTRLRKLSGGWSAESRRLLARVEQASARGMPSAGLLAQFGVSLQREEGYTRSSLAVKPREAQLGQPLQQFVRLQPPVSAPSPPDLELAFTAEPLGGGGRQGRWDLVQAAWLTGEPRPAVLVADAREVRRADAGTFREKFPGGDKAVPPSAHGVLAFDWNNDLRTDLLLAGAGGLRFLQQDRKGAFADVTAKTGLAPAVLGADYYGAWAADVEMDGDLDVIAAPRSGPPMVLRNNRDGTFTAVRPFAGVRGVRDFAWADFDNDGAPDAALLDAAGRLHVFANERSGQFRRRSVPDDLGKLLALAVADLNDDGVLDLVALRADGVIVRLSDKDKGAGWDVAEVARWPGIPTSLEAGAVRLLVGDLDNNGGLDLVAAGPQGCRVWLADGPDKFHLLPRTYPERVFQVAGLIDSGRLDLLGLTRERRPVRLAGRSTKDYHWQVVQPRAASNEEVKGDNRINSFGIGSEVEVRTGTLVQKQMTTRPVVHFGLGAKKRADVLRIQWPNGTVQVEFDIPPDQVVRAEQRLKGSCPFLFAWDGKRVGFVTDFMWSTPLGMYINAQDKGGFLQTTDWVKIRGDQLVPRGLKKGTGPLKSQVQSPFSDGYYDVRVNANLWETHYYDYMALIVVDHPPGTEMFVDEKFAVTPLAPEVYLTAPPRPVARAWDDRGHDVIDVVRAVDGRRLDTFGRGKFQGVTRDHWVEVDLGDDAPRKGPVWLLAHGWVHPTDSSINFALEQGRHALPKALVLEVPDGKGGWKVGRSDLGFPAGKDKTLMVRLDGITGKGVVRRFRLRTNMEVYWDALQYARGLDGKLARQKWLRPYRADLRYRGILEITQADPSAPEIPHYDRLVCQKQHWRDLIGYYTRFGDVRELLARVDDRYVIMNAGDEIVLRFRVPAPPPKGWKRDFVWVCDGWAKDGDLNTRFSKTVLPLPAHDLKTYVTPPGPLEDDPVYRRFPADWQKYHTRFVRPDVFEEGLRPPHPAP
jgi:tetratricopeptide (TPR) repeat protein